VTTGASFPSSPRPADSGAEPSVRLSARRRYKFYRPHRVHYYLVLTGITLALLVCALTTAAWATKRMDLAAIAFVAVLLTDMIIFSAFFMGFFMIIEGNIPTRRIKVLLPHAGVGMLSPLLYTLNIAAALDSIGEAPVSGISVIVSYVCLVLLLVQFAMGKAVVRPEPLRLVSAQGVRRVRR
jgi:hypothetical protein